MENKKKKTDWRVSESVGKSKNVASSELISASNDNLPNEPEKFPAKGGMSEVGMGGTPEGVIAQFQSKTLSRRASVAALKIRYESELDTLEHRLSKACQVEKARADVIAEQYLKELDAQHLAAFYGFDC